MATMYVFKSRDRHMQIPTTQFGILKFVNYRLFTSDQKLVDFLNELKESDPLLGIYVDPDEKTFDGNLTPEVIKNEEIKEFLRQKEETRLPDSTSVQAATLNSGNTEDNKGNATGGATRFSVQELLKQRLNNTNTETKPQ